MRRVVLARGTTFPMHMRLRSLLHLIVGIREETVRRYQVDPLVNLVEESFLLLDHTSLHLSAKILGCSLGNLLDLSLPSVGCLRQLAVWRCYMWLKYFFVQL